MVSALAMRLALRDLSGEETLAAIELAEKRGVQGAQGARIHDLLQPRGRSGWSRENPNPRWQLQLLGRGDLRRMALSRGGIVLIVPKLAAYAEPTDMRGR